MEEGAVPPSPRELLWEVTRLFLKLGTISFGGPAVHIGMMHDEAVVRRKWVTNSRFLDLLGVTNLIPGPNSSEMAMHLGYSQAGWRGLCLAGCAFILPATVIVLALSWAYVRYGSTPEVTWLLYGIKPAIIVIVVRALVGLLGTAVRGWFLALVGAGVLAAYLLGLNEIALLFGGGLFVVLVQAGRRLASWRGGLAAAVFPLAGSLPLAIGGAASVSIVTLFLTFLKIGSILYGSGYVLLAFLRNDFVERLGWLTEEQLLDAIAIGQVTPGPLFTSATFIGYLLEGFPGAVLATLGIFLPSFIFVAIAYPLIPRLRASAVASSFLDGVNVSALGLMAGVTWVLARSAIVDWATALIAAVATVLALRYRINAALLVLAGALFGLVYRALS